MNAQDRIAEIKKQVIPLLFVDNFSAPPDDMSVWSGAIYEGCSNEPHWIHFYSKAEKEQHMREAINKKLALFNELAELEKEVRDNQCQKDDR